MGTGLGNFEGVSCVAFTAYAFSGSLGNLYIQSRFGHIFLRSHFFSRPYQKKCTCAHTKQQITFQVEQPSPGNVEYGLGGNLKYLITVRIEDLDLSLSL